MDLHTKILATLWILAVITTVASVAADKLWRYEWNKDASDRNYVWAGFLEWTELIAEWPSRILSVAAALGAVVYGLMWVWS